MHGKLFVKDDYILFELSEKSFLCFTADFAVCFPNHLPVNKLMPNSTMKAGFIHTVLFV